MSAHMVDHISVNLVISYAIELGFALDGEPTTIRNAEQVGRSLTPECARSVAYAYEGRYPITDRRNARLVRD